jgi:lysophospholipase L1-like esterase
MAVKDVDERDNRWQFPFASALRVEGFFLAPGGRALRPPRPHGPRVEFLGDSITQGVRAVGPNIGVRGSDATRDYAWITGQAFGGDFRQTGFGAQGITRPGGGGVPPAPETLGLNFAGSPIDSWTPDAVVVNQGTNDALNDSLDGFTRAYQDYLRDIRERWPDTWVFAMRPFGGYAESRIRKAVRRLDDPRVVYVDTSGWIRPLRFTDGLHPSYSGHLAAARHLRRVVEETTGWQAGRIGGARVRLLAAGGTGGFEGRSTAWGPGRNVAAVRTRPASTPAAYQGERTLRVRPTPGAPATDWHTVVLDEPVRLPREARSVFVFAAVDGVDFGAPFDARVRVVRDGTRHTKVFREVPNLPGFLPWSRLHVNLPRGGDATRISVAVRAATFGATGPVGFQLDAVGWTSRWNG